MVAAPNINRLRFTSFSVGRSKRLEVILRMRDERLTNKIKIIRFLHKFTLNYYYYESLSDSLFIIIIFRFLTFIAIFIAFIFYYSLTILYISISFRNGSESNLSSLELILFSKSIFF